MSVCCWLEVEHTLTPGGLLAIHLHAWTVSVF